MLLDEIGRGTSTYDGLALAWATAAHLAEKTRAFTLFATHYFELTGLPATVPDTANVHLAAAEYNGRIVFLHQVEEGPASQSYGCRWRASPACRVRFCNRPGHACSNSRPRAHPRQGTSSRRRSRRRNAGTGTRPVRTRMDAVDPAGLTPRQALDLLYELKRL